jgi:hypothetical protein
MQRDLERETFSKEKNTLVKKVEETLKFEKEKIKKESDILISNYLKNFEEEKQNNQREVLELKIMIKKIEGEIGEPFDKLLEFVRAKKNEISKLTKNTELLKKTHFSDVK